MACDYIISGSESEIIKWAEFANNAGFIACIKKSFRGDCCSRNGSCGISGSGVGLKVMRIENAEEFIGIKHEAAVMLTCKPARQRPGNDKEARRLIQQLLRCMNPSEVNCYESLEIDRWRKFEQ